MAKPRGTRRPQRSEAEGPAPPQQRGTRRPQRSEAEGPAPPQQRGFRELVYRLTPRGSPASIPLRVADGLPGVTVETTTCHLDERGNVWRILVAYGDAAGLAVVRDRFLSLSAPFIVERDVMGESPAKLVLFYKYRRLRRGEGFSNTGAAFRMLGRDTVVTDVTHAGSLVMTVLSASPRLKGFFDTVQRRARVAYEVRLLRLGPPRGVPTRAVAEEDERLLVLALRRGYFGRPRRAGVRDLARELGWPATTVSYRLRGALGRFLEMHLG